MSVQEPLNHDLLVDLCHKILNNASRSHERTAALGEFVSSSKLALAAAKELFSKVVSFNVDHNDADEVKYNVAFVNKKCSCHTFKFLPEEFVKILWENSKAIYCGREVVPDDVKPFLAVLKKNKNIESVSFHDLIDGAVSRDVLKNVKNMKEYECDFDKFLKVVKSPRKIHKICVSVSFVDIDTSALMYGLFIQSSFVRDLVKLKAGKKFSGLKKVEFRFDHSTSEHVEHHMDGILEVLANFEKIFPELEKIKFIDICFRSTPQLARTQALTIFEKLRAYNGRMKVGFYCDLLLDDDRQMEGAAGKKWMPAYNAALENHGFKEDYKTMEINLPKVKLSIELDASDVFRQ